MGKSREARIEKATGLMNEAVVEARDAGVLVSSKVFARSACNPRDHDNTLEVIDAAIARLKSARAKIVAVEELWDD